MTAKTASPTKATRAFHSLNPAYIDAIYRNEWMSTDDVKVLHAFIADKKEASTLDNVKKPFGASRERRLLQYLRTFREFSPVDYRKITLKHMTQIMTAIKNATTTDGKPRFSQNTFRSTIAASRMFLQWLVDNNLSSMTEKDIKKIGTPKADEKTITDKDLLTEDSRDAMIKACQNNRDRAIISLMFEAGLRPVEIGRLTFADVEFTSVSMTITTKEKTGRERKIPAPLSKIYLKTWINELPYEPSPDAVVFCSLTPTVIDGARYWLPLKDDAIRRQIKTIAINAGIKNYRKMYQFRHTAISNWINGGIPERMAMKMSHGGDTRMFRIYYHVTDDELENRVLQMNGVDSTPEPIKKAPAAHVCPACGTRNPSTLKYCGVCGTSLNPEEYQKSLENKDDVKSELEEMRKTIREMSEFIINNLPAAKTAKK